MPVSRMKPGPIPTKPPRRPDPNITPSTMKGNCPPKPPRPPESPGFSTAQKDHQPSKTPPPAPSLPTRDSSRKSWPRKPDPNITPIAWQGLQCPELILRFIDWLNVLLGAEKPKGKPKRKETDEQMATLADLFEEAEVLQRPEAPPPQPTVNQTYIPKRTAILSKHDEWLEKQPPPPSGTGWVLK